MKRFSILNLIMTVLLLLFVTVIPTFSADDANNTISVIEGDDQVVFYGVVEFVTADAEDNHTTKAISDDGWLDWENAVFTTYGDATTNYDIDVFFLGAPTLDLTYAVATYTQAEFNDIGSATPDVWYAFKDTLGSGNNVMVFTDPSAYARFKIVKFDGQSGNPNLQTQYWYLVVPKKEGAPTRNAYGIFSTN